MDDTADFSLNKNWRDYHGIDTIFIENCTHTQSQFQVQKQELVHMLNTSLYMYKPTSQVKI